MLRRRLGFLLMFCALALLALPAQAQRDNSRARPSPNATVSQTIGTSVVAMHYSRPGVKGRTIFGDLVSWDSPWRAGANEPTTITIPADMEVEGAALAAGTYSLFIIPRESGPWSVIFHEPIGWGTQYNAEAEVLRVEVEPREAPMQEWLLYTFEDLASDGATVVMHWAETAVPFRLTIPE